MQLIVQLPSFFLLGRYRFVLDLRTSGARRECWSMLGPIVIGSAAGQMALFFDRFFASTLPPGYMSGMNYALKLVYFPQQIFAAAIATDAVPAVSPRSSPGSGTPRRLRNSVVTGLRLVNFIMIPAICGLVVLAYPITQVLFERGEFRTSSTELVAETCLPSACVWGDRACGQHRADPLLLSRAKRSTARRSGSRSLAVVVNVALSILWLPSLGARGLLLANGVERCDRDDPAGLVVVWKLVHGLDAKVILRSLAGTLVASAAMVSALRLYIAGLHRRRLPVTFGQRVWLLFGELAIGALVFVAVARLLRVEELDLVVRLLVQKFERHLPSAPENRDVPIA